ncbi:MAG: helix-turn-helix transcriptional regulator [Firmicutes bacterium]|nr:helix-turn-helix transcriptional regulator [Bacillota bacterium]
MAKDSFGYNAELGFDCLEMTPEATLYSVPGVAILIANIPIEFPSGQHSHAEYEFVAPLSQDMAASLEGQSIILHKRYLRAFNPWQKHGVMRPAKVGKFFGIMCEATFLQQLAAAAFGQAEVVFSNSEFAFNNRMLLLLSLLVEEGIAKPDGYEAMQQYLVNMLLLEIIRCSENNISSSVAISGERAGINRALAFIESHFMQALSVETLAAAAGLSLSHFIRAFKLHTGKTPHAYLTNLRIEKATEKLQDKKLRITDIALACGFSNPGHFTTVFKRIMGITPSEYRKALL